MTNIRKRGVIKIKHPKIAQICSGAVMSNSIPYNHRFPNLECRAKYVAVHQTDATLREQKCIECATPFLVEEDRYIQYEAAWSVTLVLRDVA